MMGDKEKDLKFLGSGNLLAMAKREKYEYEELSQGLE